METDDIERKRLIEKIEFLEEEQNNTRQLTLFVMNFVTYGFAFWAFSVINSWAWFGFHRKFYVIAHEMILAQILLYILSIIVATIIAVTWWEKTIEPISEDVMYGLRMVSTWARGAIRGGKSALMDEL